MLKRATRGNFFDSSVLSAPCCQTIKFHSRSGVPHGAPRLFRRALPRRGQRLFRLAEIRVLIVVLHRSGEVAGKPRGSVRDSWLWCPLVWLLPPRRQSARLARGELDRWSASPELYAE